MWQDPGRYSQWVCFSGGSGSRKGRLAQLKKDLQSNPDVEFLVKELVQENIQKEMQQKSIAATLKSGKQNVANKRLTGKR